MKYNTILVTASLIGLSFFGSQANAQQNYMSQSERDQADSTKAATVAEAQGQTARDADRMAEVKNDRKRTKAKAKNAQRIENDANAAARESRYAVRAERRAQKSRQQADKQADKAGKARDKSDKN